MRAIATLLTLAALSACGFREDDPELDEALGWVRNFNAEQPDLSRSIARECEKTLTSNPYFDRNASLQLFQCMRAKYEAASGGPVDEAAEE